MSLVWMMVLVLQLHWRTVALLVLDAVALPEWNDNAALALAMGLAVLV